MGYKNWMGVEIKMDVFTTSGQKRSFEIGYSTSMQRMDWDVN